MSLAGAVVDDLYAESEALDALVAPLTPEQWTLVTPAPGWTIAHQIGHLWWTDRVALLSITDEPAFDALVVGAQATVTTFVDDGAAEAAELPPAELLAAWRLTRADLHAGHVDGGGARAAAFGEHIADQRQRAWRQGRFAHAHADAR